MSGAKNLSESIFNACEKNPRLAFFVIPLGVLIIWWAGADAKYFQSMREKPTYQMHVTSVHDAPNSRGFSAPHVFGETPNGEVSFIVSTKEADRIQPGQDLQIVETGDSSSPYLTREALEEQLSGIYFSVAGLPVNTIVILGSVIALGALGWGLFGKAKAAETQPSRQTT
jgi:hypothetical protein